MSKFLSQVREYNDGTSIHGLKYITEDGRHIIEHCLWGILFCTAVGLMITFMRPGMIFELRYLYTYKQEHTSISS